MILIPVELIFVCGPIIHFYSSAHVYSESLCYVLDIPCFPHCIFPVPLLKMSCLSIYSFSLGSQFYLGMVCNTIWNP